jgi:chromosome segregation ATPase
LLGTDQDHVPSTEYVILYENASKEHSRAIAELHSQLNEKRASIVQLELSNRTQSENIARLSNEKKLIQSQVETVLAALVLAEANAADISRQFDKKCAELAECRSKLSLLQSSDEEMRKTLKAHQEQAKNMKTDKDEADQIRKLLSTAQDTIASLKSQLGATSQDLTSVTKQSDMQKSQLEACNRDYLSATSDLQKARRSVSQLEATIIGLQNVGCRFKSSIVSYIAE